MIVAITKTEVDTGGSWGSATWSSANAIDQLIAHPRAKALATPAAQACRMSYRQTPGVPWRGPRTRRWRGNSFRTLPSSSEDLQEPTSLGAPFPARREPGEIAARVPEHW